MIRRVKNFIKYKNSYLNQIAEINNSIKNDLKNPKVNLGQLQAAFNNQKESISSLGEVEFQVFSQWGDDGIIQYLTNKIDIPNKTFIEFGVENYTESNTRFLLINNNWTGYVLDGSRENISYIKNDLVSWACELYAEQAFITAENINELLRKPNFDSEIGILSIDIDGNDYWVWKAVQCISPVIVIVEYNSVFGKNTFWTVPYDPAFVRYEKHWSNMYYGASLQALNQLAEEKGYSFIGCNSKGNNAYFLRNDKLGAFAKCSVEEGYIESKFREAMDKGERVSGRNRIKVLTGLDVFNIQTEAIEKINPDLVKY